jgi:hypothetical protein
MGFACTDSSMTQMILPKPKVHRNFFCDPRQSRELTLEKVPYMQFSGSDSNPSIRSACATASELTSISDVHFQ